MLGKSYLITMKKKKPKHNPNTLSKIRELTEKAHASRQVNDYASGEKLLLEAVAIAPDHPDTISNYVNYCIQVADNNLNYWQNIPEAISYYQKALAFDCENINILTALAHAFKEAGNILDAFLTLQKVSKINRNKN